jgi:hypothetical protein
LKKSELKKTNVPRKNEESNKNIDNKNNENKSNSDNKSNSSENKSNNEKTDSKFKNQNVDNAFINKLTSRIMDGSKFKERRSQRVDSTNKLNNKETKN